MDKVPLRLVWRKAIPKSDSYDGSKLHLLWCMSRRLRERANARCRGNTLVLLGLAPDKALRVSTVSTNDTNNINIYHNNYTKYTYIDDYTNY